MCTHLSIGTLTHPSIQPKKGRNSTSYYHSNCEKFANRMERINIRRLLSGVSNMDTQYLFKSPLTQNIIESKWSAIKSNFFILLWHLKNSRLSCSAVVERSTQIPSNLRYFHNSIFGRPASKQAFIAGSIFSFTKLVGGEHKPVHST